MRRKFSICLRGQTSMLIIVGLIIVIGCVIGGYMAMGGQLGILMQPFEVVIIGGSGVGAYIIGNPPKILGGTMPGVIQAMKGPNYKKPQYIELLSVLYQIFKLAKSKGMLALESHIDNPHESTLFGEFPGFQHDHHATEFVCDYLRLLTLGTDNALELDSLMELEIDTHHHEEHEQAAAMQNLADSFPALGIVAAVLGVIKTMTYISAPPEVLGEKIAAALVGTFLGILLCYGMFGPVARAMEQTYAADGGYLQCARAGLIAHVSGYAPAISVEFARKTISHAVRPSFNELEEVLAELPSPE